MRKDQKSFKSLLGSLWFWSILFFLSTFSAYVTAESELFYRDWLIEVEFLAALISGAGTGFILYKAITEER